MSDKAEVRATKACDYCRLRKIKCIASRHGTGCEACSLGQLECSYLMVSKRRGPAPKRRHIVGAAREPRADMSTPQSNTRIETRLTNRSSVGGLDPDPQSRLVHRFVFCPVFDAVMQDYLSVLYALIPVVHVPTFVSHLQERRHHHDLTFQMFCLAISACTFGILPHKFAEYVDKDASTGFTNRRTAIAEIHHSIITARSPAYHDDFSHEKWAISYLFSVTHAHLGHRSRAKIQFAECNTIVKELGLQRIASYHDLNHIERQIRKKAFWLSFIGWSHMNTREVDSDLTADRSEFEIADAEHLMPLEVDDEYITCNQVHPQPEGKLSVVSGFNALIHITDCLVPIFPDSSLSALSFNTRDTRCRVNLGTCKCGRYIHKAPLLPSVMARFVKATHVLDDLPLQLSFRAVQDTTLDAQFGFMTANIHVTHVWVRSLLLESLMTINGATVATNYDESLSHNLLWTLQEDICKQLTNVLNDIPEANLKPNGYILISKARVVAASLLDSTLERDDKTLHQARRYLQKFADVLARLDESYRHDETSDVWTNFHARF
ncbi:hypothetical protein AUEXF2481DRAFT_32332 [Aureobasidium subglaciale EXF-2481]|uniref:Zn(2)-C6 fungal-type domain-containing protein n=1 Tax=Aureobasidium subglaciale (strain EXF-2481) TaxID=1043005 RepID=A0A074YZ81_AURSE|nr:uncharacterized protein AUEXF2481DRAFT_32332 [Aureobasidium subglaciale EXF-2481]KEQ92121.1 hypothetical protein AUEXF2481DRAFT_32332 [Aureobasidium subglaciale EXF-2481]